ncbi:MAG TPA: hypothetical protein VMF30_18015 [Pirellulales bacterium]|nr:hypothetical protein [Pirellulales bacterium]
MEELLQEYVDSRGVEMRVDRQQGVLRGVKLLGLQSRNGRKYLPEALASARTLYEGARVNVNHAKGHPLAARDYQDRLGVVRQIALRGGEGLFGDLHFNPRHALAEQLVWDAEHAPENVGLSHNVQARTLRQGDETLVEAILKVHSVDLVADPATTAGLFEQVQTTAVAGEDNVPLVSATVEQLRTLRPDLVQSVAESVAAELAGLRHRLDDLNAKATLSERWLLTRKLLAEYQLPDPELQAGAGGDLVSQTFLEALLAAGDPQAMRQLVAERAQLVKAATRVGSVLHEGRPLSREQQSASRLDDSEDRIAAFVRAIT